MKVFAIICLVTASAFAFASCDEGINNNNNNNNPPAECQHSFSDKWSSDADSHWHQATCEHGEIKDGLASHTDADEDGGCDACGYEVGHTHSFSSDWSYDEENHWNAATCTHGGEKNGLSLHSDDDGNGECEVCGGHVHILGPSGFCNIESCGKPMREVDKSSLEAIINAITGQSKLVNGVCIEQLISIPSDYPDYYNSKNQVWESYNRTNRQTINVTFGKNGYVNSFTRNEITTGLGEHKSVTLSTFESWYELDGSSAFGLVSEDGGPLAPDVGNTDKLLGNYYSLSTVANGYGTEGFLYNLYLMALSADARDFAVVYDSEENKINFRFNLLLVRKIDGNIITVTPGTDGMGDTVEAGEDSTVYNVNYFEIEASFCYDDRFVLTYFDVICNGYTNDAGQLNDRSKNLRDVNIRYDEKTGTIEFVKYDPDYNPDGDDHYMVVDKSQVKPNTYSYVITQTVGERSAENENPKSKYMPESFDVFTDEGHTELLVGTLEAPRGKSTRVYLGNFRPEGTTLELVFDLITFDILAADGGVIEGVDIMTGNSDTFKASFTYIPDGGRHFLLIPLKAGSYTLVIYYQGEITYRIPINSK